MSSPLPIRQLDSQHFDVVIIGGGINGAAGAQELAARGLKVALFDKGDFGSGSSSRSSRLLHCGLRYLAPGSSPWEFVAHPSRFKTGLTMARLAIEARDEFVKTTSTRAQLSKLYFPIYKGGSYSGWQVDAAFTILHQFNRGKTPLNYHRIKGAQARNLPLVSALKDQANLDSVACYDEYQISWPERVTLDVCMDAGRLGALVRNYTSAQIADRSGDGWEIVLTDVESQAQARVTADAVVNTAGIWIDQVFDKHRTGKNPKVLGTKGSHIVVKLAPDCKGIGVATMNRKNEPFYCLPWGHFHYLGPTEIIYKDDLDRISTRADERDWLLGEANHMFPKLNLTAKDVLFTWSGVRPLTWDAKLPGGNRKRVLHNLASDGLEGVYAMTGGPLMTHRSAGIEIADAVETYVRRQGAPAAPRRIAPSYRSTFPNPTDVDLMAGLRGDVDTPSWLLRTLEKEQVQHLSDLIMRRTGVIWYHLLTDEDVSRIARHIGSLLGWNADRQLAEITQFYEDRSILQGTSATI